MNIWAEAAKRAGLLPEAIAMCETRQDQLMGAWPIVWMTEDELRTKWQERRSDMRTVEYELWQTEKRDDKGEEVRKEERIVKAELFTDTPGAAGEATGYLREEILQLHLEEIAERKLKFSEVSVRVRPF